MVRTEVVFFTKFVVIVVVFVFVLVVVVVHTRIDLWHSMRSRYRRDEI
jgi:hypothetical protein